MPDKSIEERVSVLETSLKFIATGIEDIRNNHLEAIYKRLGAIEQKLSARPTWLLSLIIAGLCSLCTGLIILLLKG